MDRSLYIKSLYEEYMRYHVVETPVTVGAFYSAVACGTGRTHAMIMALPDEPVIILAHSHAWGKAIIETVRRLRPDYNYRFIHIATKQDFDIDPVGTVSGHPRPIFVDNAVTDSMICEYIEMLNAMYGPRKNVIDLEKESFKEIMQAAGESNWIPKDNYHMLTLLQTYARS